MTFGAQSTGDEVLAGQDLKGKRILVTGVSAGLGVETARALVARGATVVGAARDLAKAEQATAPVRDAAMEGGSLELVALDLASLASVRACADSLIANGERFDVIICNAGVMASGFGHTADGFELQFGTNHLGHFVLANRLAPLLGEGGRLVVLSSSAHRGSDVDIADPNFLTTDYDPWKSYSRAKTANALFAVEFDRRHRGRGVRAAAVHPGGIQTELTRHLKNQDLQVMIDQMNVLRVEHGEEPSPMKTVAQGVATTLWAAVTAPAEDIGGHFCEDCHVADLNDDPYSGRGVKGYAIDADNAKALWAKSEEMVGERF